MKFAYTIFYLRYSTKSICIVNFLILKVSASEPKLLNYLFYSPVNFTLISISAMLSLVGFSGSFMISSNNTDLIWRSLNWQIYPLLKMGSCRYMKYQDVNILHTNTWGNSKFLSLSIHCTVHYAIKCLRLYWNHEN